MNKVYNALTEKEKDMIYDYIGMYAGIQADTERAPLEKVLKPWSNNKENLFNLFGGELIKRYPVIYERKESELYYEADGLYRKYYLSIDSWREMYERSVYATVQNRDLQWEYVRAFSNCFTSRALVHNATNRDIVLYLDSKEVRYQSGTKPMKIIKHVLDKLSINDENFEQFRLDHSRLLNQKKLEGTLCLSIHPLDFMTMSDNSEGWSSCMSWKEDGGYRRGTVECMNSPHFVVAYVESNHRKMSGFDWGSKKWRSLIVVHDSVIASVKNYPYYNEAFTKAAIENIFNMMPEGKYYNKVYDYNCDGYLNTDKKDDIYIEINYEGVMYNDFGSCDHLCYLSEEVNESENCSNWYIELEGDANCMQCGEWKDFGYNENKLVCVDCTPHFVCSMCGGTHELAYRMTAPNGEPICECCFEDNYREVQFPESTIVPYDECVRLGAIPPEYINKNQFDDGSPYIYVKKDIWLNNPKEYAQLCASQPVEINNRWTTYLYVDWTTLTDYGKKIFCLDEAEMNWWVDRWKGEGLPF